MEIIRSPLSQFTGVKPTPAEIGRLEIPVEIPQGELIMKRVIRSIMSMLMGNKSIDEAMTQYLEDSKLILNVKFGTYLNNVVGLDLDSLLSKVDFDTVLAIATSDCPNNVINAISAKMPVKIIDQGSSCSEAMANAFDLTSGDKLTIIGRISPYHKRKLESKGVTVLTLEVSEAKSCTNLDVGLKSIISKFKTHLVIPLSS